MVDGLAEMLEKSLWMLLWRWMCGVAHAKLQRCFDTKLATGRAGELVVSNGVVSSRTMLSSVRLP